MDPWSDQGDSISLGIEDLDRAAAMAEQGSTADSIGSVHRRIWYWPEDGVGAAPKGKPVASEGRLHPSDLSAGRISH